MEYNKFNVYMRDCATVINTNFTNIELAYVCKTNLSDVYNTSQL